MYEMPLDMKGGRPQFVLINEAILNVQTCTFWPCLGVSFHHVSYTCKDAQFYFKMTNLSMSTCAHSDRVQTCNTFRFTHI